jgi:hypothetical protein
VIATHDARVAAVISSTFDSQIGLQTMHLVRKQL